MNYNPLYVNIKNTSIKNNYIFQNKKFGRVKSAQISLIFGLKYNWILVSVSAISYESEKVGLKLNIQKTKIMASGPITSWRIDGETMETVTDFIFGDSKNHRRW